MSKIVFLTKNSQEIRKKLEKVGFSVCICAKFKDSIWLSYSPNEKFPYEIHGEGYADPEEPDAKYSPTERIKRRLKRSGYYSEDRVFYDTVEEFLKVYGK